VAVVGGIVSVTYVDNDADKYVEARRALDGTWSFTTIDPLSNAGQYGYLFAASDGTLWQSYIRAGNTYVARRGFADSGWALESLPNSNGYINRMAERPDGAILFKMGNPGRWYLRPAGGPSFAEVFDIPSCADAVFSYDRQSDLHLICRDPGDDLVEYKTNAGGSWVEEPVAPAGETGEHATIHIDAEGKVHTVYYDVTFNKIRYSTNATGSWTPATLDNTVGSGTFPVFLFDDRGASHLFYRGATGELRSLYEFAGWLPAASVERTTPF
jgi:hypothetical protein